MPSFDKTKNSGIITQLDGFTLGTLADATALKQDNPLPITQDFRVLSVDLQATLDASTANEGPIALGIANDDLTVSEIGSSINTDGPLSPGDRGRQESAERAVFIFDSFYHDADGNGKLVISGRFKVRWTFYSGSGGWTLFCFNHGGAALTTGGIIRLTAKFYGVWVV